MLNKTLFCGNQFLKFCLLPVLLLFCQSACGQGDTLVKLRISIIDSYTKMGVKGASVVNRTNGTIATTNASGYTETKANPHNQFYIVATGYHALPVSIADSARRSEYFLHLVIEPFTAGLNTPVVITGNKTLESIGQDKRHLGLTSPELAKPKIAFSSVIGLAYDRLGARGKEREALKKEMVGDDLWKLMTEYLNYCNEKELISLPKESYNDFISYCNLSVAYFKSHADYEILAAISNKFEQYAKEKGLVK